MHRDYQSTTTASIITIRTGCHESGDDNLKLRRRELQLHHVCDDMVVDDNTWHHNRQGAKPSITGIKPSSRTLERAATSHWKTCLFALLIATTTAGIVDLIFSVDGGAIITHELPDVLVDVDSVSKSQTDQKEAEGSFQQSELSESVKSNTPVVSNLPFKTVKTDNVDLPFADADKEPILSILRQAGIDTSEMDQHTYNKLPTWSQVQSLYGKEPRIHGLETCQAFRDSTDPSMRFTGIAGMFNSGTNLLAELMGQNCQMPKRMEEFGVDSKGMRWQVPWGKHTPANDRMRYLTANDKDVPVKSSLPLVTIRDPYQWMQSMCRHPYTMTGIHTEETCPHLVRQNKRYDWKNGDASSLHRDDLVHVNVTYANIVNQHDTIAHLWSDWYGQYLTADFPRIFVRYEDLLFYGEQVTETLCSCVGGVPQSSNFKQIQQSAKLGDEHDEADQLQQTNLLHAIIRYGRNKHRLDHLIRADLDAAREFFDPQIMNMFDYQHPL